MTRITRSTSDDPRLQLLPASGRARLWLLALTTVLPVAIAAIALVAVAREAALPFWPSGGVPGELLVISIVLVVCAAMWWLLDRAMRRHRLLVDGDALDIRTSFYRVRIGLDELQLDAARVIDVHEHTGFRPTLRSNGFSVPGFQSGWFRLRNRHKALVAGVGERRVLWLPTSRGYGLWLQPRQPQVLLDTLRDRTRDMARNRDGR